MEFWALYEQAVVKTAAGFVRANSTLSPQERSRKSADYTDFRRFKKDDRRRKETRGSPLPLALALCPCSENLR